MIDRMIDCFFFVVSRWRSAGGGWQLLEAAARSPQSIVDGQRYTIACGLHASRRLTAYCLPLTFLLLFLTACSYDRERQGGPPPSDSADETTATPAFPSDEAPVAFSVFLENSGSMDGYVQGVTSFEDDIYQLLVDIGYISDTLSLFYINSRPIPYPSGTEKFISNLEPTEFQQRGGNRSNSDLNRIFGELLQRTSDQQAGLLISDFILSLGKGNTEDLLNNQRISVYNTFRQRLEVAPFATCLVKMYSDFTGNYYTKDDHPVYLNGVRRPYYLWFTGPTATIQALPAALRIAQLPGFTHSYTLLPQETSTTPFYTVLNNTYKQGSFRSDRAASGRAAAGREYVHGIENAKASQRGEQAGTFGFSVAADLSGVAADASYLLDPANYQVQGYQLDTVVAIDRVDALHPRDQAMAEGIATHVLVFSATGNTYTHLQVALKKQTPAWVQQTGTDNDTNIKNDETLRNQTFGFRYLVAGVEEAYWSVFGQVPYFTLQVSVNR